MQPTPPISPYEFSSLSPPPSRMDLWQFQYNGYNTGLNLLQLQLLFPEEVAEFATTTKIMPLALQAMHFRNFLDLLYQMSNETALGVVQPIDLVDSCSSTLAPSTDIPTLLLQVRVQGDKFTLNMAQIAAIFPTFLIGDIDDALSLYTAVSNFVMLLKQLQLLSTDFQMAILLSDENLSEPSL